MRLTAEWFCCSRIGDVMIELSCFFARVDHSLRLPSLRHNSRIESPIQEHSGVFLSKGTGREKKYSDSVSCGLDCVSSSFLFRILLFWLPDIFDKFILFSSSGNDKVYSS